jgi:iron complex outermembrane receptor protein
MIASKRTLTGALSIFSIFVVTSSMCAAQQTAAEGTGPSIEGLKEIVVTAQKREERLQEVPIAITAIDDSELRAKTITSIVGVLQDSPSVMVETGGRHNTNDVNIVMRGQGRGPSVEGLGDGEGAVGFYQDGFYISNPKALNLDLGDVERVEVLRGPQGTLYGRNTTGGAINLISKKPTGEFGVKETADFGSRNLFRSLTVMDLPSWHALSAKVTFLTSSIDGLVKNLNPSSHDFGEQSETAGRVQLRLRPSEDFTADYFLDVARLGYTSLYQQKSSLTGALVPLDYTGTKEVTYFASAGPMGVSYRPFDLPLSHDEIVDHGLTLTWDLDKALTIRSLTGYHVIRVMRTTNVADRSGYPIISGADQRRPSFSQELQFLGELGRSVRYVGGLYYDDERNTGSTFFDFTSLSAPELSGPGGGFLEKTPLSLRATSKAVFGQATWTPLFLEQALEVTLGARYTEDSRAGTVYDVYFFDSIAKPGIFDRPVVANDESITHHYHSFDPTFTVSYRWTSDLMGYAKVGSGYKSGGILFSVPGFNDSFKPEKITTYELGLKSEWLDKRLRLNADIFYSNYRDLQQILPTFGSVIASFNDEAINLGRATISGAEMEVSAKPTDALSLGVSYAFLTTKFNEYDVPPNSPYDHAVNPASPYKAGDNIAGLFTIPYAPQHSIALNGDYTVFGIAAGGLSAHVDYRWQAGYYPSANLGPLVPNRDLVKAAAFGKINAGLTWTSDLNHGRRLRFGLWGKNLTNYRQFVNGSPTSVSNQVPPLITQSGIYGWWLEGRTYGGSFGFEF